MIHLHFTESILKINFKKNHESLTNFDNYGTWQAWLLFKG
jgi:hypothetical protein